MKATLTNYRQSPRKTRLVANLIRGKSVTEARRALMFLPKKSAPAIQKLLDSAISNARSAGMSPDSLVVKSITVNKGQVLRRFKPMARGRAAGVRRTRSIISLELGTAVPKISPSKLEARSYSYDPRRSSIRTSSRYHSRLEVALVRIDSRTVS